MAAPAREEAPGPGQGTGLPWESAAQPEPQRLRGKPGLLGRAGEVTWGERWQERDSQGHTLVHRFERKRRNRLRV